MQNEANSPLSAPEPPMSRVPLAKSCQRRIPGEDAARPLRTWP